MKIDLLTHSLWKSLKKSYTLQNTTNKYIIITFIDELPNAKYKNQTDYYFKYFSFKASIKKQTIFIKGGLKIQMLNKFGLSFKTFLTVVNNKIWTYEKLKVNELLFKAIEKEKT